MNNPGGDLLSHRVSPAVPSALKVLTSEVAIGCSSHGSADQGCCHCGRQLVVAASASPVANLVGVYRRSARCTHPRNPPARDEQPHLRRHGRLAGGEPRRPQSPVHPPGRAPAAGYTFFAVMVMRHGADDGYSARRGGDARDGFDPEWDDADRFIRALRVNRRAPPGRPGVRAGRRPASLLVPSGRWPSATYEIDVTDPALIQHLTPGRQVRKLRVRRLSDWRGRRDASPAVGAGARGPAHKKKPRASSCGSGLWNNSRRRPTLPQSFPCSTIGPGGLNFRVRDGIGCGPSGIDRRKPFSRLT